MSRYVTARLRVRRDLAEAVTRYWFDGQPPPMPQGAYSGINEMAEALRAALRSPPRRPRKPDLLEVATTTLTRLHKRDRRASKREETARIWEECWKRAEGLCECCGSPLTREFGLSSRATLDHWFGRGGGRLPQSERTCWMLRWDCHLLGKSLNKNGARIWHETFIRHCERYGYTREAEEARKRLEGIITIREEEKKRRAHAQK
jgi:hypothetical protein